MLANGGDQRVVDGKYLINLSRAPFTPHIGDKVALLVAGTSADDTRRAAKALFAYGDYEFSGSEVMVSGTSLTDIDVGAIVAE